MNLSSIALKNLKRNFSFYSLYLFSVSFVLMIYFCFTSFSMNQIIMEKISSDGRVETMCRTIAVFIMAFVIFYMFYSNNFFMRRRMRELGIYSLLGYRKSTMLKLLTFENIIICFGGMALGILLGSILHKIVIAGIVAFLGISVNQSIIPLIYPAAVKAILSFVIVVLVTLTISNAGLLRKSTLLDLVRLEKKTEKPIHPHAITAVLGVGFLVAGYALALDIMRGKQSLWNTVGFSPVAMLTLLCVVAGTVLFIYSFLPYVCQKIRRQKSRLYHENTIIVVPKFMHRIRSNAKSLILLILLTAGTLAVFGSTVLSMWYPYQSFQRIIPSAIEYRVANEQEKETSLQALQEACGKQEYEIYETTILKVEATSDCLPTEYNISKDKGRIPGFECISRTDYVSLLSQQGKKTDVPELSDTDCILIKYYPDHEHSDMGVSYRLNFGTGTVDVTVKQTSLENPIGFSNSVGTLIVSDNLYQKMYDSTVERVSVISINGAEMRSNETAYTALKTAMPDNIYLASAWQRENTFVRDASSTFLLICFTTIIFLIATGSILYFQNISSVTYDKPDYEIMQKMGYSHSMIKKCVRRQIQIYYGIPYVMGLLHSIFAMLCYKSALMDDLLGRSSAVVAPILLAVVIFSIIYTVYYQLTKRSCYKIALK
ncbi:MAG: ABC transporter permease [Anaerotignum sp.]|nr:ABC transporter permease [Anaerotignum sp.]